jgi:hypothetical protein
MQSNNKNAGNGPGDKSGNAKHSNDFSNEMGSGTITEGSGDNGASTLRALRKKHSNENREKRRSSL